MKEMPYISVIIPTYHDWDRLILCLEALKKQRYPQEKFEILVVNNDPYDSPPAFLELPENCQLLEEGKPGSYSARNKALSVAEGDIYAFTDSDCQPQSDWLVSALDQFGKNPSFDRIGGKISLIIKNKKPTLAEIYEKAYAFRQNDFVKYKGMAATGNMIAKKKVFDVIGFFNDDLMSGGDAEWGMRAHSQGFKIFYSDECVVWHPTRSQLSEIVKKTKREAGGHILLMREGSLGKKIGLVLIGFLPPVRSMVRVFNDSSLPITQRVESVSVRYYLRLISTIEKIKIMSKLKSAERV